MADLLQITYLFMIFVGWWLIPLIVLWIYKRRLSKYPIDCVIYEKRGENLIVTNDIAGRFDEPVVHYRLKRFKDTIPIPNYDWILQNNMKPTNLFEKLGSFFRPRAGTVTLLKYGSKQYKPVNVKIGDKVIRKFKEAVDKKGNPIYVSVYDVINVKDNMSQLEFEVIDWDDINHMTQELRATALRRSPLASFLEKYGGYIGLGIGIMALIFAGYYYKEIVTSAECGSAVRATTTPVAEEPKITGANVPIISDMLPAPGT